MYQHALKEVEDLHSLTLDDANGAYFPNDISGRTQRDVLPSTTEHLIWSGILPPADPSEIVMKKVQNRNAKGTAKLKKLIEAGDLSLADTKGYRVRAAYRLIRSALRIRGFLSQCERLEEAMHIVSNQIQSSGWHTPILLFTVVDPVLVGNRAIRGVMEEIENGHDRYSLRTPEGLSQHRGTTTLPPPIPDSLYPTTDPEEIWAMRIQGYVPEDYDPKKDRPLCLFCEAMSLLAHQLNIEKGAPEEPWSGIYGLAGLTNPYTARLAWPTSDEVIMYEREMMLHVFSKTATMTEFRIEEYLRQYFGLTRFESIDITKSALLTGGKLYQQTVEEQRAAILKKIEFISDSTLITDPRTALAAVKLQGQILGLTTNENNETIDAIRSIAEAAIEKTTKALPAPTPEE